MDVLHINSIVLETTISNIITWCDISVISPCFDFAGGCLRIGIICWDKHSPRKLSIEPFIICFCLKLFKSLHWKPSMMWALNKGNFVFLYYGRGTDSIYEYKDGCAHLKLKRIIVWSLARNREPIKTFDIQTILYLL